MDFTQRTLDLSYIPQHIGIIMDGNGRWARQRHMPRTFGHKKGTDAAREIVETCGEIGVKALTLFAFSEENWQRPKSEIEVIMRLMNLSLKKEKIPLHKQNVRLKVIGEMARLPKATQVLLQDTMDYLKDNTGLTLTIALSYSGQSDILSAVKKVAVAAQQGLLNPADINHGYFETLLMTADLPPVDLVIRTSGELRISNFMLWQIAYSELVFSPVFWPDFNRQHLISAIQDFQTRKRRFGKIAAQAPSAAMI